MVNSQLWKDYGFVVRGKQRMRIINLINKPMTVTELKKKSGLSLSETSRVLRGFEKEKLAKCITPEHTLGRVYILTKRGEVIKKELNKE